MACHEKWFSILNTCFSLSVWEHVSIHVSSSISLLITLSLCLSLSLIHSLSISLSLSHSLCLCHFLSLCVRASLSLSLDPFGGGRRFEQIPIRQDTARQTLLQRSISEDEKGNHSFRLNVLIWYDMTRCDTIRHYMIHMIWYDMIWYDTIWYDMIWYDRMTKYHMI